MPAPRTAPARFHRPRRCKKAAGKLTFAATRSIVVRLEPRESRRLLEQQRWQLPRLEPQQQLAGESEQQSRLPPRFVPAAQSIAGWHPLTRRLSRSRLRRGGTKSPDESRGRSGSMSRLRPKVLSLLFWAAGRSRSARCSRKWSFSKKIFSAVPNMDLGGGSPQTPLSFNRQSLGVGGCASRCSQCRYTSPSVVPPSLLVSPHCCAFCFLLNR